MMLGLEYMFDDLNFIIYIFHGFGRGPNRTTYGKTKVTIYILREKRRVLHFHLRICFQSLKYIFFSRFFRYCWYILFPLSLYRSQSLKEDWVAGTGVWGKEKGVDEDEEGQSKVRRTLHS